MPRTARRLVSLLFPLLLALLPVSLAWAAPAEEGRHYARIEGGAPWQATKGKIEVAELFAYWCDHCARFQPMLEAWKAKQSKDVQLTYLPLASSRNDALARGFFATQAAGSTAKVHGPLFKAIHQQQTLPKNPSSDELAAWYGQQGLNAKRIKAAMDDPALADKLAAARKFAQRSGVEGTPTLVINGRYRILGSSYTELLQNADAVIAQLRAGGQP